MDELERKRKDVADACKAAADTLLDTLSHAADVCGKSVPETRGVEVQATDDTETKQLKEARSQINALHERVVQLGKDAGVDASDDAQVLDGVHKKLENDKLDKDIKDQQMAALRDEADALRKQLEEANGDLTAEDTVQGDIKKFKKKIIVYHDMSS